MRCRYNAVDFLQNGQPGQTAQWALASASEPSGVLPLKFLLVVNEMHKNPWRCPKLHRSRQHCLHMKNLNSDLDNLLIFICKHSQLAGCGVIYPWLETWDAAITGGTRIWGTVQHSADVCWPYDIVPGKIKSHLNCHYQLTCDDWEP